MNEAPRVSVVMAVHNGGELLRETIESILAQTMADFEFIVVDDGSTDGSPEIVASYPDDRIRLLRPGRLGCQSRGLNLGVEAARAPWIARIDADDPAHPERLERMVAVAEAASGYGVIGADFTVIFDEAQALWTPLPSGTQHSIEDVTGWLALHNPIQHSSVLIRKEAFEAVGGFDPALDLVNDYWLWGKITQAGWKIGRLPLVLQAKRVHGGQHFENKNRLRYLFGTLKPQMWIGRQVLGLSPVRVWAIAAARLVYGLLPQKLRASVRNVRLG